ncbi:MAG: phage shock protein PspA [Proteobacteria bacterium]|nr:phage shock protein PspA [Pseudomonadota bacterium]
MGVFSRVRDIINSNINSMLDKAEDPEKMVKLMIQEMEDTLVEIKASCANVMASRHRLGRALDEVKERAGAWVKRAELAVNKGREDLAREALMEKRRYLERQEELEREANQIEALIEQYQGEIGQLEDKLAAAREKQRVLIQRHIHAQTRKRAQTDIRRYDTSDAFIRFEQFENRVERLEAEADLVNHGRRPNLEDQFLHLGGDEEIERELSALKARTSEKSDPGPSA